MSGFALIKEKIYTFKAITKRYVKIGSPCLVYFSNLKHRVVLQPLITHDSWFFIKICIHFRNSLLNSNFFNTHIKKEWLVESKDFSLPTVINSASISKKLSREYQTSV